MEKITVVYGAGEGRYAPMVEGKSYRESVDYMSTAITDDEGKKIELYAEEVNPSWDGEKGDETATYDSLKKEILRQAKEAGTDPKVLRFLYDDETVKLSFIGS